MKRLFVVCFSLVFVAGILPSQAQVAPTATSSQLVVNAGGEASAVQPDFNVSGHLTVETIPYRLYGVGAYVDADFNRWVQIEAEGRWAQWHQYSGDSENTYMIGPRLPIVLNWKGLTPYAKFLFGWGSAPFLVGRASAWAYGGGVDYRLRRSKFTLRCFDFEYQDWQIQGPVLHPYEGSVGLSYKVF